MTIRWDPGARRLTLSVRDIAEEGGRRFGSSPLPMMQRARLGQVEHERIQSAGEARDESYRRELPLAAELTFGDVTAAISGRVDALYEDGEGWVIEEIKTVLRSGLGEARAAEWPEYVRQLQLYRWLLERGPGFAGLEVAAPRLELHLVALPERESKVLEVGYDAAECEAFVANRIAALVAAAEATEAERARRRGLAERLRFPFERPRREQQALIEGIAEALAASRPALVSAATGLGKSVAALLPALREAFRRGGQVFVATSKTTQQAIFQETLAAIARASGVELHGMVMTAREKVCQNEVVLCHPEACAYARDYEVKAPAALEELGKPGLNDGARFVEVGRSCEACPFFLALDVAPRADVIIGDYNYVFDPGASIRQVFLDDGGGELVLVIDEAHNLVDRGAEYYSPELPRELLGKALDSLNGGDATGRRLRGLLWELVGHLQALEDGREPEPEAPEEPEPEPEMGVGQTGLLFDDPELVAREARKRKRRKPERPARAAPRPMREAPLAYVPQERCVELDPAVFTGLRERFDEAMIGYTLEQARGRRAVIENDPVVASHRALSRFATVLERDSEAFSRICRRSTRRQPGSLKVLCKDPSEPLGERLKACAGVVAISATLEPFEFYGHLLGFPEDAARLRFGSPFERRRRGVFIEPRISTRYRAREREMPRIAAAVREVAGARRGNLLVFGPSYAVMEQLAPQLEDPRWELICQRPGLTDAERRGILERLAAFSPEGEARPVLLAAVQGGIFSEGVDYPGELCTGVVLIGPALPKVGFERRLIQAYFEAQRGDGFRYAYLYPGMNRVIQAAGRVLRRERDAGVIVLLGERFMERDYARLLPEEWYGRSPRELVSRDLGGDIRRFWRELHAANAGIA